MLRQLDKTKAIFRYLFDGRFDHVGYQLWVRAKGLDFALVSVENLGAEAPPHTAAIIAATSIHSRIRTFYRMES